MKKRSVVITGIGVVSPNGLGRLEYWNALRNGISGIRMITLFDVSDYPCRVAGEVSGFRAGDYLDKKEARRLSRSTCFGVAAARMALADAGLDTLAGRETAVIMGTTTSDNSVFEDSLKALLRRGVSGIPPFYVSSSSPNSTVARICGQLEISGVQQTMANDCTAGLDSVVEVCRLIIGGRVEAGVAGGADSPLTRLSWGGFCRSGLLPKRLERPESASRPFDFERVGGIGAEGAGILLLEEKSAARRRGAKIYGEVVGWGGSSNGSFPEGLAQAMNRAFCEAGVSPDAVDCISAHGSADQVLDREESGVIREVFGPGAYRLPVSSIKSMIGNPLAAAGPLQVAAGLLSLSEGVIPPTVNLETPDPDCDLDYVPNRARRNEVSLLLVNAHGLGGANTCLLVKKCHHS